MSRKPDRLDQILSEARLCEWLNLPLKERSRRSQTITYWIKAGLPCIEKSGYRFFIEMEKSAQWQAEQQRIQEEANRKRAEAAKERERTEKGTFQPVTPQVVGQLAKSNTHSKAGSQAKAMASKTNRGTVERMDRLYRKRRDLYDAVVAGQMTEAAAIRQMKKDETREKLGDVIDFLWKEYERDQ